MASRRMLSPSAEHDASCQELSDFFDSSAHLFKRTC
jgi:hypothetical protein